MLGKIGGKRKDSPRIALVVEMEEIDFVVEEKRPLPQGKPYALFHIDPEPCIFPG